jgi:uncharacterized repeat protein (TIGR01451 family)
MTEPDSVRRFPLNRSMLGRVGAVILFVGLGTLAVMHTVYNRKPAEEAADTEQPAAETSANDAQATDVAPLTDAPPIISANNNSSPPTTPAASVPKLLSDTSESAPSISGPPTQPNAGGGSFALGSPSSGPPTNQSMLNTTQRPDTSGRISATNISDPGPPPAMSFPGSGTAASTVNTPPASGALSAQIEVQSSADGADDLTPNQSMSARAMPSNEASDGPEINVPIDPRRSALSPAQAYPLSPNRADDQTRSADHLGNTSGDRTSPPPLTDNGGDRFGESRTPYDPPGARSDSGFGQSQNTQPVNNSATGSGWPANSAAVSPPAIPSSSKTGIDPFGQPGSAGNPGNTGATNRSNSGFSSTPPDSSASANSIAPMSRSFGPTATSPEAVRVMATPGDTKLEGPQVPALTIQKIAPREVQVNKPATLELIVQNTGQVPADQVMVYDRVPDGTDLIDANPKANQSADGTLTWNLGSLAAGQTSKITLNLLPKQPGEFGSVAQVTFSTQATARTLCTQPILSLTHACNPKTLIGDEVVLDITVENKGDGAATNVMLQENVPDLLAFKDGSRELEFEIGTLNPGQKRSVQLRLKADKVGKTQNRIVAQADANIQITDTVDLEVIAPELSVSGQGPDRKYLNRQATYEFALANIGSAPATNVDLVARLPRGLKFVSANNYGQYDASSNSVYWSLQQLAASQTGKVELVTLPVEPGDQKIDFQATADLNQKVSISKTLLVDYLVELAFDIDDLTDPIEIGKETVYQVKIVNQGSQPATNVRLNVEFPPGVQPMSVSGNIPHQIQGQRVVFSPIERLDSKQETTVSITAKGAMEGDHRVVASLVSDDRQTQTAKEESTRVYADRQ